MKHKQTIIVAVILAIVLLAFNMAYLAGYALDGNNEDIELGAILILTGVGANEGDMMRKGAELAVEEINAEGGIDSRNIRITYEDTPNDDKKAAVSAMHKFKNEGVDIVIGTTWSGSALAVAPIACENEMLMVAPAIGVKEFTKECDYIFNVWMADEDISAILGKRIYENGHRKLAVIGSQQAWEIVQAKSVRDSFIASGGEVVVYELPLANQNDFKTEMLKVKESGSDAVFLQYIYQDILARQLEESGIDTQIYGELTDGTRVENAKGTLDGAIFTTQVLPEEWFIEKFQERYGDRPDISADNAYDAVMLIAQAMKETDSTDPTVLKEYLGEIDYYEGASGNLKFNSYGGISKDIGFITVDDGEIIPL